MFRAPQGRENYYYFEFVRAYRQLHAVDQVEQRMLFVIAEEEHGFVRADEVFPDYNHWFETSKEKSVAYIPEVSIQLDADACYQLIRTLIDGKLVALIDAAWDGLIDNIPQ